MKQAVCVVLYNADGQILGVSRKDDPNAFGLPGGKVDPGETLQEAIIRECKEETGLDIVYPIRIFEAVCEGETDYLTTTFLAIRPTEQTPQSNESGVLKWIHFSELLKGPFADYHKQLEHKLKSLINHE